MKARVSQLCKTEAEWLKLPTFVPLKGELIVFAADEQYRYARLKIGDGITPLKDIRFFTEPIKDSFAADTGDIIDAGRVTDYKN